MIWLNRKNGGKDELPGMRELRRGMEENKKLRVFGLANFLLIASVTVSLAGAIIGCYLFNVMMRFSQLGTHIYFGSQVLAFLLGAISHGVGLGHENKWRRYFALVAAFAFFVINLIGIPNLLRFTGHNCQSEAKHNLAAVYTAYQSYHYDYGTYPAAPMIQIGNTAYNCLQVADWAPTGQLKYNYECMGTVVYWPGWDWGAENNRRLTHCPVVVTGATKDHFTVAACGNIDNDTFIDVWTIDDANHLRNIANDVNN
jgi:hypothetical protein